MTTKTLTLICDTVSANKLQSIARLVQPAPVVEGQPTAAPLAVVQVNFKGNAATEFIPGNTYALVVQDPAATV